MKAYVYTAISLICDNHQHGQNCLYLGDAHAAKDPKLLYFHKIRTIISIGEETVPNKKLKPINYHQLNLHDKSSENILQHFDRINRIIDEARLNGNVLIHCYHGVSRSASFVIAYFMSKGKNYEDARAEVKSKRKCICPNKGFIQQLKLFEKEKELHQQISKIQEIQGKTQKQKEDIELVGQNN